MKSTCINSTVNTIVVPSDFLCPITMEIMIHPVLTRYGHSFDRSAIVAWICSSGDDTSECPLTRMPLRLSDMINDKAMKFRITEWCNQNNIPYNENVRSDVVDNNTTCDYEDFATHFFVTASSNVVEERKSVNGQRNETTVAQRTMEHHRNPTGVITMIESTNKCNCLRQAFLRLRRSRI
jgi:U-box domain